MPIRRRLLCQVLLTVAISAGAATARSQQSSTEGQTPGPHVSATDRIRLAQAPARRAAAPNAADVSIEMTPSERVAIGNRVSFRVTTRKSGYVLVVDIDPTGRMSQIFPTTDLLSRERSTTLNLVRAGRPFVIPNEDARQQGINYVVTPPAGIASIIAILSDKRVQIVDLPDMPTATKSPDEQLKILETWMNGLRIPDARTGKLLPATWSFDQKIYVITEK